MVWKNGRASPAKKAMTIKQLMLHTSGLSYGFVGNGPVEKEYKKRKPVDHQGTLPGMTKTSGSVRSAPAALLPRWGGVRGVE